MRDFFVHTYDLLLKGASSLAGFFSGLFGNGAGKGVALLGAMMVADYVSGLLACSRDKNGAGGGKKLVGKGVILLLVLFARGLDQVVNKGGQLFLPAVTWFYISNEALSLLSNLSRCGVPVPARLRRLVEGLGR